MATHAIGGLGDGRGPPTFVCWRWYHLFPSLPLWLLLASVLIVPKSNRQAQAWLIVIPVVLVAIAGQKLLAILPMRVSDADLIVSMGFAVTMAWAVVWLLTGWLSTLHRAAAFPLSLLTMLVVGGLAYVSYFGLAGSSVLGPLAITFGIWALALLVSTALAGVCCRRRYRPWLLLFFTAVWMLAMVLALAMIVFVCVALFEVDGSAEFAMIALESVLMFSVFGCVIYLSNLPFLILAIKCPLYSDRVHELFRIGQTAEDREAQWELPPTSPFATEPTTRPVCAVDVVGGWQFYVDALGKSVIVEFAPDGTLAQTIVLNCGGIQEHRGGTWKLDGPKVHVEGYVTAAQGTRESRTWWFIDSSAGPRLFGGDGPARDSFFCMTRLPHRADKLPFGA